MIVTAAAVVYVVALVAVCEVRDRRARNRWADSMAASLAAESAWWKAKMRLDAIRFGVPPNEVDDFLYRRGKYALPREDNE